mmetsp:Transcript_99176/g.227772  ORF Transcript_99176/g.227772 Transcript_99176/m.227772 type:complete len:213 (+) Transcript_99176:2003-2641(+)
MRSLLKNHGHGHHGERQRDSHHGPGSEMRDELLLLLRWAPRSHGKGPPVKRDAVQLPGAVPAGVQAVRVRMTQHIGVVPVSPSCVGRVVTVVRRLAVAVPSVMGTGVVGARVRLVTTVARDMSRVVAVTVAGVVAVTDAAVFWGGDGDNVVVHLRRWISRLNQTSEPVAHDLSCRHKLSCLSTSISASGSLVRCPAPRRGHLPLAHQGGVGR